MNREYDVLIVGAGLFGATCAYELNQAGFRCVVLEKRSHIGGNCYTELRDGINVHIYGPHIFHTSHKPVWEWINQFAGFNHYRHRVKVDFEGKIYSFPPNLATFNELWGVKTPEQARRYIERVRIESDSEDNLETWVLSQVGRDIYEIFIKGYTEKQWYRHPSELPTSIIKRIPLRYTYDDNYFEDPYQGIPIGGYTAIFEKLLSGIEVRLNTDYFESSDEYDSSAHRILYTGPIDRFYGYRFGRLEYRSLRFEFERLEMQDFQGVAQMNYTSERVPYTRIVEHKHFEFGKQPVTWITKEYPIACADGGDEMYPVRDEKNLRILNQYRSLARQVGHQRHYFGGRLAEYQYYDMHQVIGAALARVKDIKDDLKRESSQERRTASTYR